MSDPNMGACAVSGYFANDLEGPLTLVRSDGTIDNTTVKMIVATDGSIAGNGDGTVTITI